jgi:hypothetical protein
MLSRRRLLSLTLALGTAVAPLAVHAQAEKKKGGGISFVQFQTLTATIVRYDGRRGVLTVEAGVDVPNSGLRDRVNMSQPLLRAAYVQFLDAYAAGLAPGQPPNADYLSQQLQLQTNQVLGRPGAKLLLGTILVN